MLTIIDGYSRECLAIDVARKLTSEDVLDRLMQLDEIPHPDRESIEQFSMSAMIGHVEEVLLAVHPSA